MMLKQEFQNFIFTTNTDGSGKTASYVRALYMHGSTFTRHYPQPIVNGTMCQQFTLADIQVINKWVCSGTTRRKVSPAAEFASPSYWTKSFCSAAVRIYDEFMAAEHFEDSILAQMSVEKTGKLVANETERLIERALPIDLDKLLHLVKKKGKNKFAAVKARANQDISRKMVLSNYGGKCCVIGLMLLDFLRTSHICVWAEGKANRLNPENGLCPSDTYDAVFDCHLIFFDEHHCIIASKAIKKHYTDAAEISYFIILEGLKMSILANFLPSKSLLAKHRELIAGVAL